MDKVKLRAVIEAKINVLDDRLVQLSYKPWHTENRLIVQGQIDLLWEILEELETRKLAK